MADSKRFFLYIALAAVAFLLWNAWQTDHVRKQTKATTTAPKTVKSDLTNNSTLPSAQIAGATTASTPATSSSATSPAPAPSLAQIPASRIVSVKTDVLNVKIDTLGGTIIKASLPGYPTTLKTPNDPFVLLNNNPATKYIAQSGIIGTIPRKRPIQYTVAQQNYELKDGQKQVVVKLNWRSPQGFLITKQFTFTRDKYVTKVKFILNNHTNKVWAGKIYTQLTRKWPIPRHQQSLLHAMTTFTGAAISTPEKRYSKYKFKNLAKDNISKTGQGGWVAMLQQYFLSAWIPNKDQNNHFYSHVTNGDLYSVGVVGPLLKLAPGQSLTNQAQLYMGPEITSRLKAIAPGLDLTIDYGWLWFISILIFWLLKHIHDVIGNWGWSIILVTVFIKALFYKLSDMSYTSMARMRKLQPKLEALKKRFGDDKQGFSKAMMELYRKEKANPLGGCLPVLVQIPVFIALYWVLIESVQLRQAPFMFWIHDLSQPDPYYVLPIIMGITMFVQQKLSPTPPDPMQAKIMLALPVVFTILFLHFPSGLMLYWIANNSLSILQQWYIMRKIDKQSATSAKRIKRK